MSATFICIHTQLHYYTFNRAIYSYGLLLISIVLELSLYYVRTYVPTHTRTRTKRQTGKCDVIRRTFHARGKSCFSCRVFLAFAEGNLKLSNVTEDEYGRDLCVCGYHVY